MFDTKNVYAANQIARIYSNRAHAVPFHFILSLNHHTRHMLERLVPVPNVAKKESMTCANTRRWVLNIDCIVLYCIDVSHFACSPSDSNKVEWWLCVLAYWYKCKQRKLTNSPRKQYILCALFSEPQNLWQTKWTHYKTWTWCWFSYTPSKPWFLVFIK